MEPMGKRLRRLREGKNLSISEVSRMTKIPISTYREWEYGREIKGEPYLKLAEVFGVTLHELITGLPTNRDDFFSAIADVENALSRLKKNAESFF